MPHLERHVFVCTNERGADNPKGSCGRSGGAEVRDALKAELAKHGLNKRIRANSAGCLDQCDNGVAMVVYPEQVWYGKVTVADIKEIVDCHLIDGQVVTRLLANGVEQTLSPSLPKIKTTIPASSLVRPKPPIAEPPKE
jgi:(2Fe-2S) ferredoxin